MAKQSVVPEDVSELGRIKDTIFSDVSGLERVRVDPHEVALGGLDGLRA